MTTVEHDPSTDAGTYEGERPRWLLVVLGLVCAVALLGAGAALTVLTGVGTHRPPAVDSVDAGFARDMATHHSQAVQMAQVERDNGSDPAVRLLAFDIETGQLAQVGQMRGWLDSWDQTPQADVVRMAWMGHPVEEGQLMPGMASTAELARLKSLSGKPLDVYFLQLMIRHHKGGLEMAQYGAAHASQPYVRDLAGKIVTAQQNEVVTMEQMLRERGAQPLS
ncbi:MAG TPA: DUF305 domain-containing protein [Mycobacteriales bacterium]|nr:DUF305 domain-containing protein [Mycobacteriales bacterium]